MRQIRTLFSLFGVLLFAVALTTPAVAQTTTATIRGQVTDEGGTPVAGAEINAVNTATGFVHTVTSRPDGSFVLAGLTPGTYNIIVASAGLEPRAEDLTLLVGQTQELTFRMTPAAVMTEEITVIGTVPIEMEATEVATNVTRQQIENLPQNERNFMNFAGLAPGVTLSTEPQRKTFQGGVQRADAVNVFVDGVSFKNDVIQGGVVGQDASRGNPFPQNAVQEFRVLTQNYSAEYQKASSSVITAVTKSGTNQTDGEVFAFFQDDSLVDENPFTGAEEPFFERLQTGFSVGGPIQRDRMHYFAGYEGNDQDREFTVRLGGANVPPALRQQFLGLEGVFPETFEQSLFFGKLSFQPAAAQLLDISGFLRDESDRRRPCATCEQQSAERMEEVQNNVWQIGGRHQFTADTWFNEASLSYQDFHWEPRPINFDIPGRNYFGLIEVGGGTTAQDIQQQRLSLRDDVTLSGMEWQGNHLVKIGATIDQVDYSIIKFQDENPVFNFRSDENWEFPFQAVVAIGDPELSANNTQFGLYVQDEWGINDNLLLNLGVRWDYESEMFPTDWVTPADVRQKFATWVDADRYFTDGDDRDAITDMFAPRLGFAYDVFANSRTVVFGGWGRYYDRILFNNTFDERFRLQHPRGEFLFSRTGEPRDGRPTIAWRDEFLTPGGVQQLIISQFRPEVFLIENDTQPQYSDQWTIGVRQSFGALAGSLSYGNIRSFNGFTFTWGHLNPDQTCCRWGEISNLGYAAILVSNDDVQTWYDAIYLTLDKPFSSGARWGGSLSYTNVLKAETIGGDLFSLDFPLLSQFPRRQQTNMQDHTLIANALFRLPLNFNFGTVARYGSGYTFDINEPAGDRRRIRYGEGSGEGYFIIDLRLEYEFQLGGTSIGLIGEAFNVTNDEFFSGYEGNTENPNFGKPFGIVPGSQRRFQYGARFRF